MSKEGVWVSIGLVLSCSLSLRSVWGSEGRAYWFKNPDRMLCPPNPPFGGEGGTARPQDCRTAGQLFVEVVSDGLKDLLLEVGGDGD